MTWKAVFDQGVACFDRGDLVEALAQMDQAAEIDSSNFIAYDLRAEIHEKLGDIDAALRDSERVIDLAPGRRQGYVRSARLLYLLGKHDSVIKVVDQALRHLRPDDSTSLVELRGKAVIAQGAAEEQRISQVSQAPYIFGKLPVETLMQIFAIFIDEDHTYSIKLSHVCGHWRQILINTPSAWRTLTLYRRYPLQKAMLWKERAKNRITHLFVDMSEPDRATVFAQLQDLRWDDLSCLHISGNAFVELHRILSDISLPYAFSNLDELSLFDFGAPDHLSCCLSGPCWKLKVLHLTGVIRVMDEWWQRIRELKELHLNGYISRFSPLVFTANPSLEKLFLSSPNSGHGPNTIASSISMDNLKTIECRGITRPFTFLHCISAPSITHFRMLSSPVPDEALLRLASCPSLVELYVSRCTLGPSTLPTVLSSTPNLETLKITYIHSVVNGVFRFLTPDTDDSVHELPCRALRHIDVSYCSDLTTASVYAFVKTRTHYAAESVGPAERCATVVSLKMHGCPKIEPNMLTWFRSNVAQFNWKARKLPQ